MFLAQTVEWARAWVVWVWYSSPLVVLKNIFRFCYPIVASPFKIFSILWLLSGNPILKIQSVNLVWSSCIEFIFWEGHKILRNLPLTFDYSTMYWVHTVKSKGKISKNFVAFSEYSNFKIMHQSICILDLNVWRINWIWVSVDILINAL